MDGTAQRRTDQKPDRIEPVQIHCLTESKRIGIFTDTSQSSSILEVWAFQPISALSIPWFGPRSSFLIVEILLLSYISAENIL